MGDLVNIESLVISKLNQISNDKGAVYHFINKKHSQFLKFGEVYFSKINFKVVKGWKLHQNTIQNFCVPYGKIKMVFYDPRKNSNSYGLVKEINLDYNKNYNLVTVPPGIWYSFRGDYNPYSLLANLINIQHKESLVINSDLRNNKIPFEWE